MNKSDLIQAVASSGNIPKKTAEILVNTFIDTIIESLANGESITLMGFGKFEPKDRAAQTTRNFRTGEKMSIPAHKIVKFKAGKQLGDAVNIDLKN